MYEVTTELGKIVPENFIHILGIEKIIYVREIIVKWKFTRPESNVSYNCVHTQYIGGRKK